MQSIRLLAAGFTLAALSGCASLVAPPYSADYEALDRLKKMSLEKIAVNPVQPRDAAAPVNKITLRGASLVGSKGTFAEYLEDALIQDLRDISLYDAGSGLRLDATILKNDIDVSGLVNGTGQMDVEIAIGRSGKIALKKIYSASTRFDSSFAGAVAIPKGQAEYGNLVRTLLAKIYLDPDFINARKK